MAYKKLIRISTMQYSVYRFSAPSCCCTPPYTALRSGSRDGGGGGGIRELMIDRRRRHRLNPASNKGLNPSSSLCSSFVRSSIIDLKLIVPTTWENMQCLLRRTHVRTIRVQLATGATGSSVACNDNQYQSTCVRTYLLVAAVAFSTITILIILALVFPNSFPLLAHFLF